MPSVTVATFALLVDHCMDVSNASSGVTVAINIVSSPTVNVSDVLSNVILVTRIFSYAVV